MKKKDIQQIRNKDIKELAAEIAQEKKNLFSLHLDFVQNKLKNVKSLSNKRKDIARMSSILREKELLA